MPYAVESSVPPERKSTDDVGGESTDAQSEDGLSSGDEVDAKKKKPEDASSAEEGEIKPKKDVKKKPMKRRQPLDPFLSDGTQSEVVEDPNAGRSSRSRDAKRPKEDESGAKKKEVKVAKKRP